MLDRNSDPSTSPDEARPIYQRLDTVNMYPYSLREYARRFAWQLIGQVMVRLSLPRANGWRRFWLRLFGGQVTPTSDFKSSTKIRHPWLLKMGRHTTIAEDVEIYNLGPVEIGDHSVISQRAYICAGTHDYTEPSLPLVRPPIKIGSGVWICAGAFIGPGVTVGDNSIVGAYGVVTKDIPPDTIVAGNPARVIKKRPMRFDDGDDSERPLRITIMLGPFLPAPPAPCGAVEFRWIGISKELVRRGHSVTVLCRGHETQQPDETIDGVRFIRRTRFKRTRWLFLDIIKDFVYSAYMVALAPRADVAITNAFWAPVLARFKRRMGKVVVCVGRFPKGQFFLYGNAERIQAVSNAVSDAIIEQHPSAADRVRVIPNPIDFEVFRPPSTPRRRSGDRTILYTGRIHPEKGLHLLIKATGIMLKRRPDLPVRVKIMGQMRVEEGGGGLSYVDELRSKAEGLPIEFLEPVYGRKQLAKVLQGADYYVYPSMADKGESFGVAPLEAMATGLPVIVSRLGCFRDFIVDGETGLVFDHHAEDAAKQLASILLQVIEDDELAERLGDEAHRKAAEFAYPKVADIFVEEFRTMVGGEVVTRSVSVSDPREKKQSVA